MTTGEWVPPMLATLTERPFSDPDWIFERKLDGVRCLAHREGASVRLFSRNRQRLDAAFPEVVDAVGRSLPVDGVLDGEVVAFAGRRTSFELLQRRLGLHDPAAALATGVDVFYYVFDAPLLGGEDLRGLALIERKRRLRRAVAFAAPLRHTTHRVGGGEALFRRACALGWEGLVAKRAASTYTGARSKEWLKLRCWAGQELVVVGFTAPRGSRVGLGALLVGYFEQGKLRYAGKVGTGFDSAALVELRRRLDALVLPEQRRLAAAVREPGATFVQPRLVVEVGFSEWTRDGKLRHPRYLGLREDKAPEEVVREQPG